ncbi:oligosaccharide flippase family protein [Sagittula sp. NFXS13]
MLARLKRSRRGIMVLSLKGCEALAGAAMTILLARIMGPSQFGFFAFGLATTTLLAIPIKNGASTLITKHVAIAHEAAGLHQAGPMLAAGIRLSLLYAAAVLAGLWGARVIGIENPFVASVALVGLALPFMCLTGLWEGVLRGSFQPSAAIMVGTVLVPLITMGLAAALGDTLASQGWQIAAGLYVGTVAAVCLLGALWARPTLKRLFPVSPENRMSSAVWIGHAAPFAIVTGLLIFNRQIDVILLGTLKSEEAAGIYRIAAQAAILTTFGSQAIVHLYAPYLATTTADSAPRLLSRYLQKSVVFSIAFGTAVLLFLFLFGELIIRNLAGPEYLDGYPVMLILCSANLLSAANGALVQALYMQGHQSKAAWIYAIFGAYTVAANATLIPIFGILGAAIASASAIILWSFALRVLACRTLCLSFFRLAPKF